MGEAIVSVIVPTHNSSRYIRDCMDSLLDQTCRDIEVICVDSSHNDDTREILCAYKIKDSRVSVIIDENSSYGHKINVGISNAKGSYIMILESDDRFKPEMIEKLKCVVENTGADFAKCEYSCFGSCGKDIVEIPNRHFSEEMYNRILYRDEFKEWQIGSLYHIWTGIYRKDFLQKNDIRLNESAGASYQDIGFSILCNVCAESVYFIPEALYMYRVDNEASSVKSNKKYRCIKEEHDLAYTEIKNRKKINEENIAFLKLIRHSGYRWNLQRLDSEYREKFLDIIKEEADASKDFSDDGGYIADLDVDQLIREANNTENYPQPELMRLLDFLMNKEGCVIFGAGKVGNYIMNINEYIPEREGIKAICDSSSVKQGTKVKGIRVVSPDEAVRNFPFANYIIANRNASDDIKHWLIDAGIQEDRITIFRQLFIDAEILLGCIINAVNQKEWLN